MLARTITVPRSTGPTFPGIAIASPARPPSNGPVSETVPLSATGASPLPASALTEPTRVSAGHAPASACAPAQTGTPFRLPASPGGSSVVTRARSSEPSGRETSSVTAPAGRPAAVEVAPTLRAGAKAAAVQVPPRPSASIVKLASAVLGAVPLHGVRVAVSGLVPHAAGLASTAFAPPWNVSANDVNGTCGRLSKTVVICPVAGSRRTSPASATFTPLPATSM